jgi:protocatechuate 3,4-dioxygenase beta subunit
MTLSRRALLLSGLPALLVGPGLAARGRQGLEQFGLGGPPCAVDPILTPAVPPSASYRPWAPERSSLVDPGTTGIPLAFSGTVTGLTCGRIAGARVDVWHADARGTYDMESWRHRGHQRTDEQGQFRFRTVMPGAPPGRAPHVAIRVIVPDRADFATELFFPGDPRNAADPHHQATLELRVLSERAGQTASFDLYLDL